TGAPVEDFAVRCFPLPGSRYSVGPEDDAPYAARARGHHPDGRLRLAGITRGWKVLVVEPRDPSWQTSDFISFAMTERGAPEQRVEVFRAVTRTLQVALPDGEPVAGSKVEVLRGVGNEAVTLATP